MNPDLKTNIRKLPTNYSTWVVAIVTGVAWYWLQLSPADQTTLLAAYPWLKHAAPLASLISFLSARVVPQIPPEEPR